MTIPQSVLVVALAIVWLVVLVPTSSRRRKQVREVVEGRGFRVLRRPSKQVNRKLRRQAAVRTQAGPVSSEGEMTTQRPDLHHGSTARHVPVGVDRVPETDAEQTVQLALVDDQSLDAQQSGSADTADAADAGTPAQQWSGAEPAYASTEPRRFAAEPIRRRSGRGSFDPELAERDRAFKYARRRRVVLALLVLTVGFSIGEVVFGQPTLWIAAGVCAALLVLFLLYLRRQVRIEADVRARRLARLDRARQIRPEYGADSQTIAHSGSRPHRVGRTPVDLDDGDPSFEHLDEYEPVEYRRAVGQ